MLLLSIQMYNMVKSRCFHNIIIFRIFSSLNPIHLPLLIVNKVNVTLLKTVSRLALSVEAYYLFNSQCFLNINIIIIVSSLNYIQLLLFMIDTVNVTLLRYLYASIVYSKV